MLSHLTSLFALIPMLLHSILGCCWHHTHECHTAVAGAGVVCRAGAETCRPDHDAHDSCPSHRQSDEADGTSEQPGEPCGRVPCEEERCSFVDTVVLVAPAGFDVELSWACASEVICELLDASDGRVAVQRNSDKAAPPHSDGEWRALTRVWLI